MALPLFRRLRRGVNELHMLIANQGLPRTGVIAEVEGQLLCLGSPRESIVARQICRSGLWEPEVTRHLIAVAQPGMTVLDVGASLGYYAVLLAGKVGPSGRVLAFEPSPQATRWLSASVALNGFSNVAVREWALSRKDGVVLFHRDSWRVSGSDSEEQGVGDYMVPMRAFDGCRAELGVSAVDLVKIDVEGAELDVLLGMRQALAASAPTVVVEIHSHSLRVNFGQSADELFDLMSSLGYRGEAIMGKAGDHDGQWTVSFSHD